MVDNDHYKIFDSEIFQKSQCTQHEHTLENLFGQLLLYFGYKQSVTDRRVWYRDQKKVIVCFSDDFSLLKLEHSVEPDNQNCKWTGKLFDSDTVVITDNQISSLLLYQLCQTPVSYFGIYNYAPDKQVYCPDRRFNFSVNRIDPQRELILLELAAQSVDVDNLLTTDYVNFNCQDTNNPDNTTAGAQHNFAKHYIPLTNFDEYSDYYQQLLAYMPIRNHDFSMEQAHVSAYVNLVIESYAGDTNITVSEKTFRALVTPCPWTVYAAKGTVDYLKSLGFDVLDDLVDHSYNNITQNDSFLGIKKIKKYISSSIELYQRLCTMDSAMVAARCQTAALHNQQRLATLRQQWLTDFASWLPSVIAHIQ